MKKRKEHAIRGKHAGTGYLKDQDAYPVLATIRVRE